jgi:predicted O-linked N-acetylglucosamine transferase (SPINDLY family)
LNADIEETNRKGASLYRQGMTLLFRRQFEEALEAFQAALSLTPEHVPSLNAKGNLLTLCDRPAEAMLDYDRVLSLEPGNAEALNNRAVALRRLGRKDEALESLGRLLALQPDNYGAANQRGDILLDLGRSAEALALYDRIILSAPQFAEAYVGRGRALRLLNRPGEAIHDYDTALKLKPNIADAYFHRGVALQVLGHNSDAVASYDEALKLLPDAAGPINNRATTLLHMNRFAEAREGYKKLEKLWPGSSLALNGLATVATRACDWPEVDHCFQLLSAAVHKGDPGIQPGALLNYHDDPSLQYACARNFSVNKWPNQKPELWNGPRFSGNKIRVAYCSADFMSHPMPRLLSRMFESHDRENFEAIAISFSVDDKTPMRARLIKAFDQFHDVLDASDRAIAELIAQLKIDIAVDLMGFTDRARPDIFAMRPAPVQVNYMGYPSTMGASFWDYIIGDPITLPTSFQPFSTERIVQLPDTYMATDDTRASVGPPPARDSLGLPENGFVFSCFNNNWKITGPVFDVWMRLLQKVPGSVLWLLQDNAEVASNLRKAAHARGVNPERLVFAPRIVQEEHMRRLAAADLFLDTLPYNAHTTGVDSLWAGVPLVTCMGNSFYSRVASSLLHAIGLPELIASDLTHYESLVLHLVQDPVRLASTNKKLEAGRMGSTLFNSSRFTRNMEKAFFRMREIWHAGRGPEPIIIPVR